VEVVSWPGLWVRRMSGCDFEEERGGRLSLELAGESLTLEVCHNSS
jgi:hypothetical protein